MQVEWARAALTCPDPYSSNSHSSICAVATPAVWVFGYVIAFPLLVFWNLLSYSRKLRQKSKDIGELRYGFLVSGLLSCTDRLACPLLIYLLSRGEI